MSHVLQTEVVTQERDHPSDSFLPVLAPAKPAVNTYVNGVRSQPFLFPQPRVPTALPFVCYHQRELPTFPLESGWRERFEAETNTLHIYPLTLLDILYPDQDELGVLVMPQSPTHDLWSGQMAFTLRPNTRTRNWLILHDVFVYWQQRFVPPAAPDLTIIPDAPVLAEDVKSYHVGRDGPLPIFVAELISDSSHAQDTETKRTLYAAVGIREYLVVDLLPMQSEPWRVQGYRLADEPDYQPIPTDEEGGVSFSGVGLRFVPVGRERIDIYDLLTGERLLTPDELKARAEAEAARADAEALARAAAEAERDQEAAGRAAAEAARDQEASARAAVEAERDDLKARLRGLEALLQEKGIPSSTQDNTSR